MGLSVMFRPTDNADNRIIEGAAVLFSPPYQTKQEELQDYIGQDAPRLARHT